MAMTTKRTFTTLASISPFAGAALSALVVGCTSANDAHSLQEARPDASEAPDASSADEASSEAGRTIKLTWQVAVSPLLTTDGLEGGASAGAIDAGADSPSDAGFDGPSDAGFDVATGSEEAPSDPGAGDGGYQSLAGVSVCVYQNTAIPCVTTDANGMFTISGLPAVSDIALTFRRDGYVPVLTAIATPNTDIDGLSGAGSPLLMASSTVPSMTPVSIDIANKGSVTVVAVIPGSSGRPTDSTGDVGAKISLSPMTGNGPYFLDQTNTAIVPSATSMVYEGAVYFNLDPGDYAITIDDPDHRCSPLSPLVGLYGYPAPPTSVKFPIVAGYSTSAVGFYCTANSVIVNTADAN
jgi:hypothetical protein